MTRRPTIYDVLALKLGCPPTNAEIKADIDRILTEGRRELAEGGKLRHQR